MKHRFRGLTAIAIAASLALAGCGGDDSADEPEASAAASTTSASAESTTTAAGGTATSAPAGDAGTGTGLTEITYPTVPDPDAGEDVTLSLVGFAVPKAANNAIEEAFAETPEGEGTSWEESYGASGDQSRAVVAGLKADYVHFSIPPDVTRLEKEGLVAPEWDDGPNKGIVSRSVVVLVVRPGNPKNIQGWDDIVKDDVGIVTPNPGSSGAARWNILAAYAHVLGKGGTEDEAKAFLTSFFENTVALPGSGRDATTAFLAGTGDVLISYENEAILAKQEGQELDYVVPDDTLLIENPGTVLIDAHPRATAWLNFVLGTTGQTEFAKKGFRPVIDGVDVEVEGANDPADPFPTPTDLFTVDELYGGWGEATTTYFDEENGIVSIIQRETGKQ